MMKTELPEPLTLGPEEEIVRQLEIEAARLRLQHAEDKPSTVTSKVVGFFRQRAMPILGTALMATGGGMIIYFGIEADRNIVRISELEEKLKKNKETTDDVKLAVEYVQVCMAEEIDMRDVKMTPEERRSDKGIRFDEISAIAETCKAQALQRFGIKTSP